jgi:hypothetical protein
MAQDFSPEHTKIDDDECEVLNLMCRSSPDKKQGVQESR